MTSAHRAIGETSVFGGVRVGRWQDDSGAALILGWQSGELLDFAPAYTAASCGLLAGCRLINESVAVAKVVDADGRQLSGNPKSTQIPGSSRITGEPPGPGTTQTTETSRELWGYLLSLFHPRLRSAAVV